MDVHVETEYGLPIQPRFLNPNNRASGRLGQWRAVPPGLTKELVASSVEVPYGYSLLLLNIVTVVGIQSGSFLLVICNFFCGPAEKDVRSHQANGQSRKFSQAEDWGAMSVHKKRQG